MNKVFFSLKFVNKIKLFILMILILLAVFLELLSLGSIFPIFSILINNQSPDIIFFTSFLEQIRSIEFFKYTPNLLFVILFIYAIKISFVYFLVYFQSKFSLDIQINFADKLLETYLNQNYLDSLRSSTSEKFRNVYSEIALFVKYLIFPTIVLFTETIVLISLIILISFIDLKFLLSIFLIFTICGLIYFFYFGKKLKKWGQLRIENDKERIEYLQYNLSGFKEIILNQRQDFFREKYKKHNYLSGINNLYSSVLSQLPRHFFEIIIISIIVVFIVLNLLKDLEIKTLIPILAFYFGVFYRLMPSAIKIYQSLQNIKFALPVFEKIKTEFEKTQERKKNKEELSFIKNIFLKKINFNFNEKKVIIKDISLCINKGECIGIIGESGTGKTTLINIIMGLIKPIDGSIEVDGIKKNLNSDNWYKKISHIPQDIFLLNDNIRNNIAFGNNKNIDDNKILNIINKVRLDNFLKNQENGLDTYIGDKGSKISGGEKQRFAIARALYKDSELLIFDEPTSALDQDNALGIMELIKSLQKNKTIIIISHNKDLINFADKIFNLDKGGITQVK
tara:strand:- start:15762 stop:17459 length:1698 start_codon:yes stop_codon:yes gene_type:complete